MQDSSMMNSWMSRWTNFTDITTAAPTERSSTVQHLLSVISASLSMVSAIAIIVTFMAFKQLRRRRGRKLIFFLSLCDFFTALSYSIEEGPLTHWKDWCKVQGLATIFFPVASFLWTLCISIFIYRSTPIPLESFRITYVVYHVICWSIPTLLCAIVLAFGKAGSTDASSAFVNDVHNTGGWCWLNTTGMNSEQRFLWELVGGKAVEISCILAVCILYFLTGRKFRANDMHELKQNLYPDSESTRQNVEEFQRKLVLVPACFVLARIWGSINTFLFAFAEQSDGKLAIVITILDYLQAFCDPVQGFLNGLLFVPLSVEVRNQIAQHWGCICKRKQRDIDVGSVRPSLGSYQSGTIEDVLERSYSIDDDYNSG